MTSTDPLKYLSISLYHPQIMKGGAQYVAKDLHDAALRDEDVDPILLAAIDGAAFPQYAKVGSSITALPDGNNEFVLPGMRFDPFYQVIYDQRRNKALRHLLEKVRPDVIHLHHSIWVGLEVISLIRKVLPDVRIIYTLHEYMAICHSRGQLFRYHERSICTNSAPDQCAKCFPDLSPEDFMLRRRGFKEAFDHVDMFISPSEHLRKRFINWGLSKDKIRVIANGHTRNRPADYTPSHSKKLNIFGFFGQFVDAKGIDVLLEAAVQIAETEPVQVRIFGGNKEYASEDYLERIETALKGASDNLKIVEVGPYSRENVFELMSSVDWVVVPSVWPETFGLVVSEAWDAKRPVIASRVGGLEDRVIDQKNGFTFLPGSATDLTRVMQKCIGNKKLWMSVVETMTDEIDMDTAWQSHKDLIQAISGPRHLATKVSMAGGSPRLHVIKRSNNDV
ncbi:glycosyltransferase [Shimia thalassica]|uniref:glycosyltransferase n=1 Tax=Shimia thalassica TaxID=1715693 RepID=UPI0024951B67|nr:glycosyltransferase [Shimia thalassica]